MSNEVEVIVVTGSRPAPPWAPGGLGGGVDLDPPTEPVDDGGDYEQVEYVDPCQGSSLADAEDLPPDYQQIRSIVQNLMPGLISQSLNTIPGAFIEFGAFVTRDASGALHATQPFTTRDSYRINFAIEAGDPTESVQVLRGIPEEHTIVAFIHVHRNDPRPSLNDALFVENLRNNRSALRFSASIDNKFVDYIAWNPPGDWGISSGTTLREFSQKVMEEIKSGSEISCGYSVQ